MKVWHLGIVGLAFAAGVAQAQTPAAVRFDFERAGMETPHWRMTLDAHGEGSYEEFPSTGAPVKQLLHVGEATLKRLNAGAAVAATKSCETKIKNVAQSGKKSIAYLSASGEISGECTYNFSDDLGLKDTTDAFLALQQTLQEGKRLAFKHRFDRLGLDSEIDILVGWAKGGRAIELQNIAAVLNSIVSDVDVLQRVRLKTETLLKQEQLIR